MLNAEETKLITDPTTALANSKLTSASMYFLLEKFILTIPYLKIEPSESKMFGVEVHCKSMELVKIEEETFEPISKS